MLHEGLAHRSVGNTQFTSAPGYPGVSTKPGSPHHDWLTWRASGTRDFESLAGRSSARSLHYAAVTAGQRWVRVVGPLS